MVTLGEGFNTQVVTLWCFNIVVREILTLGDGGGLLSSQVVTLHSLWCFNIVTHRGSEQWLGHAGLG